jgi:hypothetical protein
VINDINGNSNLDVCKTQVSEGVPVPASLSLHGWFISVIYVPNYCVRHAEHLKKMLSGRHFIFVDLGFFSFVFLFDNHICDPLFYVC